VFDQGRRVATVAMTQQPKFLGVAWELKQEQAKFQHPSRVAKDKAELDQFVGARRNEPQARAR